MAGEDKAVVREHAYKGNVTPKRLAKALLRRVKPYVKPKKQIAETRDKTHA